MTPSFIKFKYYRVCLILKHLYSLTKRNIIRFQKLCNWLFGINKNKKNLTNNKRILVVFDVSSQPFNIGDFILIQQVSLILSKKYSTQYTDIAIVHDVISKPLSKEFSSITKENIYYHLASIIPIAQINQNLGSVFIFNSHFQFENYLSVNFENYITWPSIMQYATSDYLYYYALNKIIYKYYQTNHQIPLLKCRDFLKSWAESFYAENLNSEIPVTINLRKNLLFGTERNSDMDAWYEFFKSCIGNYDVKFIIIGSNQEIDKRMGLLKNVLIAKDFNTGIEQDLALISLSEFHMGASSGPISMAWFTGKPYLMFSWDANIENYDGLKKHDDDYYSFGFASPLQKMTKNKETPEILKKGFEDILQEISKTNVKKHTRKYFSENNITWLR